jgi:hypothetical protein
VKTKQTNINDRIEYEESIIDNDIAAYAQHGFAGSRTEAPTYTS